MERVTLVERTLWQSDRSRVHFYETKTRDKEFIRSRISWSIISLSPLIANKYFLEYQGCKVGPIQLAQDNISTVVMASKGKPIGKRTCRIAIRA